MFEIPENLIDIFFEITRKYVKSEVIIDKEGALIVPPENESHYKPVIIVKNTEELARALKSYLEAIGSFYDAKTDFKPHHDVEYFLTNLYFNMTSSDALDFAKYVETRTTFYRDLAFSDFRETKEILNFNGLLAKRIKETPGFESPFILEFSVKIKDRTYPLPLVRYAIDENKVCHLFAIQYGRTRIPDLDCEEFKRVVNKINSGVHKYRNVPPSFVMTFRLFLCLLDDENINSIVVPDFLFGRYRHYYRGRTEEKSDQILERILDNFITLMQRMEYQFPFFKIESYPTELDSFTHIAIDPIKRLNLKN